MKLIVVLTIFLGMLASCTHPSSKTKEDETAMAQSDSLVHVSKVWKADTLGKKSQRSELLRFDSLYKVISVGGISFLNLTKKQITGLLGTPENTVQTGENTLFDYFLAPHCGFSEEGCYKWVLELSFRGDSVRKFYQSFIEAEE